MSIRPALVPLAVGVLVASASMTFARQDLTAFDDAKGYIDMQKLTRAQLANTYHKDANFLRVWYSGRYNGLAKKYAINVLRVKENIHQTIVYCKEYQDVTIVHAVDVVLKERKASDPGADGVSDDQRRVWDPASSAPRRLPPRDVSEGAGRRLNGPRQPLS
jgi:hypothetical protein